MNKSLLKFFSFQALLLLFCFAMLSSCGGGGGGSGSNSSNSTAGHTPFVITTPVCSLSPRAGAYDYCGVTFSFKNTSNKTVSHLKISCMVYKDLNGTNPFMGTNHILADYPETVQPGETKDFILNLDPYLYTIPTEVYLIDYFFVKDLTYSDGSSWHDELGTYSVRSY